MTVELERLRQRVAELEAADAARRRLEDAPVSQDTSDCKQADSMLREKERMLSTLMSNLPGMAYRCKNDSQWTMEFVSEGCQTLTGYQPAELVGNRVVAYADTILPADRQAVWAQVQAAVADKRRFRMTYRIRTAAGDEKWVWEQGVAVLGADRQVQALEGFICDITELVRIQEALKRAHDELEQRVADRTAALAAANEQLRIFQMFVEASGQGFGMADLDGYVTYWNPTICRFFGEDNPDNVVGKHVTSYYPEGYFQKRQDEIIPAVMRDGSWQGELIVYSPQGKATTILQNTFLIRDDQGRPVRLAAAITDITERKAAEEALRESHDELRAIYDSMGDGLLIADRETLRLIRANGPICAMLGYSADEMLSLSVTDLHPPEARQTIVETIRSAAVEHFMIEVNVPMIRKDGSLVYVDVTGDSLTYRGRPCSLGIFRDVTERRNAQAALEHERRTLRHMLQASDHERQLIAYEIHDGLAQLLTGAMMQYQAFEHLKRDHPDKAKIAFAMGGEMLQMAHSEARRLISGVRPPVLDEAGVETAIAHLVHDQRVLKGPKVEYKSEVQFHRLPKILENALYRIAQEALANACNHSQSEKVRVRLTQDENVIRLEVRDWGVGFDPQAPVTGHFGLEGIRERVRLLGGQLELDSAPDHGTLLRVEVPLLCSD